MNTSSISVSKMLEMGDIIGRGLGFCFVTVKPRSVWRALICRVKIDTKSPGLQPVSFLLIRAVPSTLSDGIPVYPSVN